MTMIVPHDLVGRAIVTLRAASLAGANGRLSNRAFRRMVDGLVS
jgi:hypothetical protein